MPITKSAIKTLKQDRSREAVNQIIKSKVKSAFKDMKAEPSQAHLEAVYSAADRAAKKNIFHANKASRIKSQAATLLKAKGGEVAKSAIKPSLKSAAKPVKKTAVKAKKTSTK